MPGLLPMKVIKVGSNAQSRVAQACDRCRSKKIRCDGVTPCCSQCANVGFECKTSDKLSRRAFPRGYTESLEERVRSLESENRELKDLLDSKDDKIDMLSRIHSTSPRNKRPSSTFSYATSSTSRTSSVDPQSLTEEGQSSPVTALSQDVLLPLTCSASASCGKLFIEALKARIRDSSAHNTSFKTQPFFAPKGRDSQDVAANDFRIPSRMASDQLINIYIQEWSPLFPIIHRPRVLKLYADFSSDPESLQYPDEFAQLYLIFAISAISAKWNNHDHRAFETKWQSALETAVKDTSVSALQCLLLAQVYCAAVGDLERLRKYKTMAVKLSRRLGLHQSQKRVSLGPLVTETRKRLFWVMFTLDCLSAAMLGQPRMLGDLDIACEMPLDVDDEDVTEDAFLTPAPGNATRFSSALAVMQGAQVMAEVLDKLYPSTSVKHVSLHEVAHLSDKLDTWFQGLAPHLRLSFLQDKPSTSVSGSRSPFLSLMYNHIRSLLHRPLVLSGNESQRSSSLVKLAQSSKYIIQIIQLLNERRMSFAFPLDKSNTITLAGFGLLYQVADLRRDCKLVQDSQKQLSVVVSLLEVEKAPEVSEFKKATLATLKLLSMRAQNPVEEKGARERSKANGTMPAPKSVSSTSRHRLQSSPRKMTAAELARSPQIKQEAGRSPQFAAPYPSSRSVQDHFSLDERDPQLGFVSHRPHSFPIISRSQPSDPTSLPNLDYLDFNKEPADLKMTQLNMTASNGIGSQQPILNSFASPNVFSYMSEDSSQTNPSDWSTDLWNMSDDPCWQTQAGALSLSEEDLTSGEELSSCGASSHFPSATFSSTGDLTALDGFTASFGV